MFGRAKSRSRKQRGFSLIETACAMLVLTAGMLGGAVLIMLAMTTNNRNKLDNSGTVLSQYIMEQVLGQTAVGLGTVPMTDCAGNVFNIAITGAAPPGLGSPLTATRQVDFTAAPVAGYNMRYVSCRANGDPITYDVRWNVTNTRTNGATVYVKQVAVAARPIGAASGVIRNYALPVTLIGATGQQ
jgi:type II secretory pathway pseudopilin PulG